MATIYCRTSKKNNTKYYGNIVVNGKRYRRYLGLDYETALQSLKKLEYELTFNPKLDNNSKGKVTLNKAILSFLKEVESSGVSYHRIKTIKLKLHALRDYSNKTILNDISVRMAKDYMQYRASNRVTNKYQSRIDNYCPTISPKTYNQELQIFTRFFNHCKELGWINNNPFKLVKPLKEKPKSERYYFTKKQIKLIMDNAGKYYDFYQLLLHTGIRATDAYKLKIEHFDGNFLSIQMNKTGDYLSVPIPKHVLKLLKPRMCNSQLFPELQSDRQRRNCVKNIQKLFESEFIRNNNINLHTFRHTYAHTMLNKGVPKEILQTLLGHRSIKTTEIYANWIKKEELEKWI